MGPNPLCQPLSEQTDTRERRPREDADRDWSYAAVSQDCQDTRSPTRDMKQSSQQPSREHGLADTLTCDFWPLEP